MSSGTHYSWDSPRLVDNLAEDACFRALFLDEVNAIAEECGRRFVPSAEFDDALGRTIRRYREILEFKDGQSAVGNDGAVAAVKGLYRILQEEYVDPSFECVENTTSSDPFVARLVSISSRGLVAHNFCYRFLVLVGWYHFEIEPVDDEILEFDALIETAVRNFDTNPNYSFEQMLLRAFRRHRWQGGDLDQEQIAEF